jgi:hypothetical protein
LASTHEVPAFLTAEPDWTEKLLFFGSRMTVS